MASSSPAAISFVAHLHFESCCCFSRSFFLMSSLDQLLGIRNQCEDWSRLEWSCRGRHIMRERIRQLLGLDPLCGSSPVPWGWCEACRGIELLTAFIHRNSTMWGRGFGLGGWSRWTRERRGPARLIPGRLDGLDWTDLISEWGKQLTFISPGLKGLSLKTVGVHAYNIPLLRDARPCALN